MKKHPLLNLETPFMIDYCSSYQYVSTWKFDKCIFKKENNRIEKIEIYNYFNLCDYLLLVGYLSSKKFKYSENPKEYPRIFNILTNQEGHYINGKGKIFKVEDKLPKYYYLVLFSRVIIHRNRTYLLKIYWNKSQNKDFVKLEITYYYFKPKGKYNIHYLDWLNALKGINEVIKKIEKKFTPIGFNEDFSKKITLESLIFQIIGRVGISKVNHIYTVFSKLTGIDYYSQINKTYPLNSNTDEDNG